MDFVQLGRLLAEGNVAGVLKLVTPANVNDTLEDALGRELKFASFCGVLHYVCSNKGVPHPDDVLAHERRPFSSLVYRFGPNNVDSAFLVTELVRMGANVNAPCRMGWTPLHLAALGKPNSVRALVACGAQVDMFGDFGFTPLGIVLSFHPESNSAAIALLDMGASIAHGGDCGTALDVSSPKLHWVASLLNGRDKARHTAAVFVGCINRSAVGPIHRDVVRLIGRHIWATRLDDRWQSEGPLMKQEKNIE